MHILLVFIETKVLLIFVSIFSTSFIFSLKFELKEKESKDSLQINNLTSELP